MSQNAPSNRGSYIKLFSNTLIFAIGTFGSKLLVLLLVPLYTAALSPDEYGTVDLIAQTANILIPIFSLSAADAALRFGLDTKNPLKLKKIYSNCLGVIVCGIAVMAALFPLLSKLKYINGFSLILFIYVCTSTFKLLNSTFVRALEKVKLFALDGVLTTLSMLILNIVFLLGFEWGMQGYLLAIILSDLMSSVFLFFSGGLWQYVEFKKPDTALLKSMLSYSAPLIPTTLLWLITSISDRFIITMFHGEYANGINSIAYKIPTILTTVFTMFSQAWNMSAITENKSGERESFYTNVFSFNQSFMYLMSAGILLLNKPITLLWVDKAYHEAYLYSPVLTVATVFTCFNVFLGSVYIAEKKTKRSFMTSLAAGAINIVLNFALIPKWSILGAAIATFISYFIVFFYRLFDTRKLIRFDYSMPKILINSALILAMAFVNRVDGWWIYLVLAVMFIAVLLLNFKELLKIALFIIPKKILDKVPSITKIANKLLTIKLLTFKKG